MQKNSLEETMSESEYLSRLMTKFHLQLETFIA